MKALGQRLLRGLVLLAAQFAKALHDFPWEAEEHNENRND
jgi:hypothetical protein